jgi:UDPglucose 6-dehydrogenase
MLKPAFLFDGRRLLNKSDLEKVGFEVFVIGS